MIRNYVRGEYVEQTDYQLCFDDGAWNGFAFPCDENGRLPEDLNPAAIRNLEWCMAHPDQFVRFNKVVGTTHSWREPSHGTCTCGYEVNLFDEYMGACECPQCGRWYSLSGQELLPPDKWGWDGTPMEEDW